MLQVRYWVIWVNLGGCVGVAVGSLVWVWELAGQYSGICVGCGGGCFGAVFGVGGCLTCCVYTIFKLMTRINLDCNTGSLAR